MWAKREEPPMGVRESLNRQNPKLVVGVLVAVVAAVAVLAVSRASSGDRDAASKPRAFFSVDDGKTWFADDAAKVPPFNKDGKEAVRAYVLKCPDGKEFVGYLERYSPEGKKRLEAVSAQGAKGQDELSFVADQPMGIEVKAPGKPGWVNQADRRAAVIMRPACPGGGKPKLVLP
jgi:hypothetical protein